MVNTLSKVERAFEITQASIKDDFCNYSYEIIDGISLGDQHNVKGSGKIETMQIHQNEKGLYSIWNNGRQLTNVPFSKN